MEKILTLMIGLVGLVVNTMALPECDIPNQVYSNCHGCPLICDDGQLSGGPESACLAVCRRGCQCQSGLAFDAARGACIQPSDCRVNPPPSNLRPTPPPTFHATRPSAVSSSRPSPPSTSTPTSYQENCAQANNGAGCLDGWICNPVEVQCFRAPCPPIPTCQEDCSLIDCQRIESCPGGGTPRIPENECCEVCPCNIRCRWGFAVGPNGNTLCECAEAPVTEPTSSPTQCFRADNVPCRMFCEFGFAQNDRGCYECRCNEAPEPTTAAPSAPVLPTASPTTGCRPVLCEMFCEHGWHINEETGCEVCQCATGNRCSQGGAEHSDGSSWVDSSDPCLQQTCEDGRVINATLQCMPDEVFSREQCNGGPVARAEGVCCPFCADGPSEEPGTCSVINSHTGPDAVVYNNGDQWEYPDDYCTTYMCNEGTVTGITIACDEPVCTDGQRPIFVDGQCCPECPEPILNQNCTDPDTKVVHAHHSTWQNPGSPCLRHTCMNGRIMTMAMSCPPPNALRCREGQEVRRLPGECCPRCVDITMAPSPAPPSCGPVCAIMCPFGNVIDAMGCPTCRCRDPPPTLPPSPVCTPACSGVLSRCNLVNQIPTCQQDCRTVRCASSIVCGDGSNGTIPENMCCPLCPTNTGTDAPTVSTPTRSPASRSPTPAPILAPTTGPTITPDPCIGVSCRPCPWGMVYMDIPGECCGECKAPSLAPSTNFPTTTTPTARPNDPSGSTGKEENSESSTIAIVAVVAILLIALIIGAAIMLSRSKDTESRSNFENPIYNDVVVNNTRPQKYSSKSDPQPQYESTAPVKFEEVDC